MCFCLPCLDNFVRLDITISIPLMETKTKRGERCQRKAHTQTARGGVHVHAHIHRLFLGFITGCCAPLSPISHHRIPKGCTSLPAFLGFPCPTVNAFSLDQAPEAGCGEEGRNRVLGQKLVLSGFSWVGRSRGKRGILATLHIGRKDKLSSCFAVCFKDQPDSAEPHATVSLVNMSQGFLPPTHMEGNEYMGKWDFSSQEIVSLSRKHFHIYDSN